MKLDDFWSIDSSGEGSQLIFSEERVRKEGKDKGKKFLFEDVYYYNNVQSCLKGYLNKTLEASEDVKDCVKLVEETYLKIEKLIKNK